MMVFESFRINQTLGRCCIGTSNRNIICETYSNLNLCQTSTQHVFMVL